MKKLQLISVLALLLFSCSKVTNIQHQLKSQNGNAPLESGVVITFDDNTVNDWFEINNILKTYEWRATFFISGFSTLSENEILKLKTLKVQGHEIAGHGFHHVNSVNYIKENGKTEYLNTEIYPMINSMREIDLPITSFAYPYGSRNSSVDSLLLNEFKMLRGTVYGAPKPRKAECYFENNRLVKGLGIDGVYAHSSVPYFKSLLAYAKKHNKIVVFYAHKPVPTFENNYEVDYNSLIEICDYVKSNNMKFYTLSELYNL